MDKKTSWSWDNLRYFLAVARHGTLSDAARHLGVSHSTVQRRIGAFEEGLQTSLFNRTSSGYTMTQAGTALFTEAAQMQTTLDSISRKISGSDSEVSGELVLTSTDTLSFLVLPDLISALSKSYPGLSITLSMMNGLSDMQNLEADIAIRTCKEPPANLIGRRIGTVKFVVCASREYCKDKSIIDFPESMDQHQVIMLDHSYSETPFYQWLEGHITLSTQITRASGFLSAFALCKASLGITLLPEYMVDKASNLAVLRTNEEPVSNDIWILSHSDLRDTRRVKVVRQYLYDQLSVLFGSTRQT